VYNPGEHVLGTTTPLFTMLGALCKVLLPQVPTPELMAWVNTLLLAAGAVIFYRLLLKLMPQTPAMVGALVFIFDLAKAVPEGMESPLFILSLLAFVHAVVAERWGASAVFLAAACLTRPDAGLVAVLAFFFWWQRGGFAKAVRATGITCAIAAPWLIFAIWYFGSPVSQSLIAKIHGHAIYIIPAIQAFKVQLAALSRIYWGSFFDPDNLVFQTVFNLVPFLVLASLGAWRLIRRGWWIVPAIPVLYFVSYSITDPVLFPWYSTQIEPLWIILSWVGAVWLLDMVPRSLRLAGFAFLLFGPIFVWAQLVMSTDVGSKGALFTIGNYLHAHATAGESVALSNIGIVGYITDAYIIDTIGLTYPRSSSFYPWSGECRDMTNLYQIPPALIRATEPDWIVAGAEELTSCFAEGSWLRERYVPVQIDGAVGARVWHKR
jgi:hypothetical protein